MDRKEFDILLGNEDFQNDLINFTAFSEKEKQTFKEKYSINKKQFVQAKTIIDSLNFKPVSFSEAELDYLWNELGIESAQTNRETKTDIGRYINWFSKIAAILFVPLLVGTIWFASRTQQAELISSNEITRLSEVYNTVYAPLGGKTKAILPDGSEVWLNSGSSLQYPIVSKKDFREVNLTGEGFFKVVKNKKKPMMVSASGMQVKVYGTTFNINAYDNNQNIETVLVEGKISIVNSDNTGKVAENEFVMKPGEIGIVNKEKRTISIEKVGNIDVFTGWVDGQYVFKNAQFKNILKRLELLHNVKFELRDKTLGDYYFDATFEDQNIDRIMEIFELSLPIKWKPINAKRNQNGFSTKTIIITRDKSKEISI